MKRSGPIQRRTRIRPVSERRAPETRTLDMLVRRIVLHRDKERCRKCGAGKRSGRGFAIQAAHILGKAAHPRMRFEPLNVITLCQPCHWWWHVHGLDRAHEIDRPNEVMDWCLKELGRDYMERLQVMASVRKSGKSDRTAIKLWLEAEIRKLDA